MEWDNLADVPLLASVSAALQGLTSASIVAVLVEVGFSGDHTSLAHDNNNIGYSNDSIKRLHAICFILPVNRVLLA